MEHKAFNISLILLILNLFMYPVLSIWKLSTFTAVSLVATVGILGISLCVLGYKKTQGLSRSIYKRLIILHLGIMFIPLWIYLYGYLVFN